MSGRSATVAKVLRNPQVRRVELAFSAFNMAEYGVWVSVLVYAYEHGGVNVTAAVAVAQLVPAGVLAPILARSVDRWGAPGALRRGYWVQALTLGVTALLLFAAASALLVYAAAIAAACAVTVTRPAQAAIVPELAGGPDELTALNVVSGWVEAVSVLAGPALAGLLIAVGGPGAAIGAFTVCTTAAAIAVWGLEGGVAVRSPEPGARADLGEASPAGLAVVRSQRGFTELVALLGAQYLVIGMLDVLLVVFAIGVLGLGGSGAGYLNAAFGAGGVVGSAAALALVGRRRLAGPFVAAAAVWSLLLMLLGAWPSVLGAFLLLAGAGMSRTLLDVSGRTILLLAAPAELRSRVFGVLEGVAMLGLAVGSLLVPVLVWIGGARIALAASGLLLSGIAAVVGLHLRVPVAAGMSAPQPAGATRAVSAFSAVSRG